MISRIEIRGLGPHIHTVHEFAASGSTAITGPSESGKSTTIEAICFVLWGQGRDGKPLDTRAIRDGHEEVRVDMRLASGTTLTRTLTRSEKGRGRTFRQMTKRDGTTFEYRTEKDWLAALKWMGSCISVLRTILVPFSWLPLAHSAGGGRAFRDLLNDVLPTVGTRREIIAEIMADLGFPLGKNDPINQSDAMDLRRRCRQKLERAKGKLAGLREGLDELRSSQRRDAPASDQVDAAREVVRVDALWAVGDADRARAAASRRAHARASEQASQWDARLAALGDRPEPNTSAIELRAARDQAAEAHRRAADALATLDHEHETVTAAAEPRPVQVGEYARERAARLAREVEQAEAALGVATDVCPTCARPGWDDAVTAAESVLTEARKQSEGAQAVLRVDLDRLRVEEDLRQSRARSRLAELVTEIAAARAEAEAAADRARATSAALDGHAGDPAVAWDAQRRTLGDRPVVPAVAADPETPAEVRPSAESVAEARAVLAEAEQADGAARQLAVDTTALSLQIATVEEAIQELEAEHERLEALVAAVRREPSESVRRQIGALGDLGPVDLELGEQGGAAVLVDGRPWHLASTGRQVVADVWLRAGLRRAAGRPKMPIAIDQTQDVGGQVLPSPPPCVLLTTTDEGAP